MAYLVLLLVGVLLIVGMIGQACTGPAEPSCVYRHAGDLVKICTDPSTGQTTVEKV